MRSTTLALFPLAALLPLATPARAQTNAPGSVVAELKISDVSGGFAGGLSDFDMFGSSVTFIGDVNGDSNPDAAVGCPDDDDGANNAGAVWILFLDANTSVVASSKISALSGGFSGALSSGDNFGAALASLPDLDGNGTNELVVGAPGDDTGGSNRGAIYVLSIDSLGLVEGHTKIAHGMGGFGLNLDDGDGLGSALAGLDDLDLDGFPELLAGARADDDGGLSRGAVYVLFMDAASSVRLQRKISNISGGFLDELEDFDQFGNSVANVGDLNGDGRSEIAVGAFGDDDGGASQGAVYILFLLTDGSVEASSKISATSGNFTGALVNGDAFGVSVAGLGDVSGEGIPDVAVGVQRDSGGAGSERGAVWVIYLNELGESIGEVKIGSGEGDFTGPLDDGDHFGGSLVSFATFGNTVADAGLEGGALGGIWTEESTNFPTPLCDLASCALGGGSGPRSGDWWVRFGGFPSAQETAAIEQDVTINSDMLGFFLHTADASGNGTDFVRVRLDGDILCTVEESDSQYYAGYTLVEVDISDYNDGASHLLRFESITRGPFLTNFFVDDIFISEPVESSLQLLVGAPDDDDGGTDRGALWIITMDGAFLAAMATRNGGDLNPVGYTATGNPVIGGTWSASIDPAGKTTTAIIGFQDPSEGLVLSFGEVLVDLFSAEVFFDIRTAPVGHLLPVPNLIELVGFTIATQGLRYGGPPPLELLNAIDVTLGR